MTESNKSELETLKAQLAQEVSESALITENFGRVCRELHSSQAQVRELRELLGRTLEALKDQLRAFPTLYTEGIISEAEAALRSASPSGPVSNWGFSENLIVTNAGEERKDSPSTWPRQDCMDEIEDLAQVPAASLSDEGCLLSQTNMKADALGGDATRAERAVTGREPSPEPRTGSGDVANLSSKACSGPQDSPSRPEWISAETRLPKYDELPVLVYGLGGDMRIGPANQYDIAWQPLPAPPSPARDILEAFDKQARAAEKVWETEPPTVGKITGLTKSPAPEPKKQPATKYCDENNCCTVCGEGASGGNHSNCWIPNPLVKHKSPARDSTSDNNMQTDAKSESI